MINASHSAVRNRLLAALPEPEYDRLRPHLEYVQLSTGQVLYEAGQVIEHVYFPHFSLISLICPMSGSADVEFSLVGNEGMVGLPAILGGESIISRAIVQLADGAMRLEAHILKQEFDRGEILQKLLLLYIQSFITQTLRNTACRANHRIEARLARWLISMHDQLQQNELPMKQSYIADLLGTRRATITEAARSLQNQGLIRYSRGSIAIVDADALTAAACECYQVLKQEQSRLQQLSFQLSQKP